MSKTKVTYNLDSELVKQFRVICAITERQQQDVITALLKNYIKKANERITS